MRDRYDSENNLFHLHRNCKFSTILLCLYRPWKEPRYYKQFSWRNQGKTFWNCRITYCVAATAFNV